MWKVAEIGMACMLSDQFEGRKQLTMLLELCHDLAEALNMD
jgi:5'-deoxynucleotidase YfbR-like HD superfamily hydrolase